MGIITLTFNVERMNPSCLQWRERYVMALFVAMWLPTVAMGSGVVSSCPETCQCSLLSDWSTSATCQLSKLPDYSAVSQLPGNATQLTCIIKGMFMEEDLQLAPLGTLKSLVLRPDGYESYYAAQITDKVSDIQRADLLSNLTLLEHLAIHIPVLNVTARVLGPVPGLITLDLSYSRLHISGALVDLLENMDLSGHRLRHLILRGVQRRHTTMTPEPLLLRDHIYKNVQNYPLATLDLLNNNNVVLQAGITTYTPNLEVLRIGAGQLLYVSGEYQNSRSCFFTELFLHKNLHELVIDFPQMLNTYVPRHVRSPVAGFGRNVLRCVQRIQPSPDKPNPLCPFVNCVCHGVITIPCDSLHDFLLSDVIDYTGSCYGHVQIPLSPSLGTLLLRNFEWGRRVQSNLILCFHPRNSLKHMLSTDAGSPSPINVFDTIGFNITGLHELEFCNFQGLGIVFSPKIALFSDMPLLKGLLLSRNNIDLAQWEGLDFMNSPSLESLDIQNCGIDEVPEEAFSRLVNLRALNISGNRIAQFDVNFANNLNLNFLNLSRNSIIFLPKRVRDNLDRLVQDSNVTLDLSQNPLSCYCSNQAFVHWVQTTRVNFKNKEATFCAHPTVQLVHPWEVNTKDLQRSCIHFEAIIASAVASIVVAMLIGAAALIYKRRWMIRFWIHATREGWKRKRRQEASGCHDRLIFKYDAFVAYASQGEERAWVHMTLREKLEGEHGLKICMYHRDFIPGRDLADAIVEAIDSSNKTLLILSPAFLQSGWCEFEVRMAKEKMMTERRDSLVIVLYSQLDKPNKKFPKSLARLLDKKIYIEWTDDPDGQELFWGRLVAAIRSDRQHDGFAGYRQSIERMSVDNESFIE